MRQLDVHKRETDVWTFPLHLAICSASVLEEVDRDQMLPRPEIDRAFLAYRSMQAIVVHNALRAYKKVGTVVTARLERVRACPLDLDNSAPPGDKSVIES